MIIKNVHTDIPATGDTINVFKWLLLGMAAMGALAVVLINGERKVRGK